LLNASVGVQRVIGRLRRPRSLGTDPATTLHTQSLAAARRVHGGVRSVAAVAHLAPTHGRRRTIRQAARLDRTGLIGRLGPDKVVALAVAGIVLGASVVSVSAAPGSSGPVGGPSGDGDSARIAVGGGAGLVGDGDDTYGSDVAYDDYVDAEAVPETMFNTATSVDMPGAEVASVDLPVAEAPVAESAVSGPFLDDGTLLKPVAVDTTVEDGRGLLKKYRVKSGDTLTGIASRFDVSMMTLYWANKLKAKDELHLGQVLMIPPVSGLVVTVTPTDTLDSLAAKFKVKKTRIVKTNKLTDPNLVVGQVLVVPGAKGKPIPTPKPTKKPSASKPRSGGGRSVRPPAHYRGGHFAWPVSGGGNYISQYYHYGHYGIDIAADYGARVRAGGSGTVIFAGWKSNGGGYQVWIAHGSGLYTTYNHMSAVTVGRGQHVGRGQGVGRVGQSGNATGPHLHFEVWRGPVWNGGQRVNPLAYL
jgi:murein DD-endopeptidase MepM/ murein hydrolase activator NlpD